MTDKYVVFFNGDLVTEGDLDVVLKVASEQLADERRWKEDQERQGKEGKETSAVRLLRVVEVPIKLVPARGPTIELAKAPRAPRAAKETKPARAAIQCPIEGCNAPGGSRRRG